MLSLHEWFESSGTQGLVGLFGGTLMGPCIEVVYTLRLKVLVEGPITVMPRYILLGCMDPKERYLRAWF